MHGIAKRKDAPEIDWCKMKDDNETMKDVIRYLNSLVTTINPDLGVPVSNCYPCQKYSNELKYDLQDYIELINKL